MIAYKEGMDALCIYLILERLSCTSVLPNSFYRYADSVKLSDCGHALFSTTTMEISH